MLTERGRKRASRGPGSSKDTSWFQDYGESVISPILKKINGQSQLYTTMIIDLDFELQFQQQGTLNVPTFMPSKETLDVDEQESEG